jgi:hypothetical protein
LSAAPQAGPITATGTASRNVNGQAIAITAFNTVKWWGRPWLPLVFLYATHFPRASGTLGKLSFIHFARWTLVKRLPPGGPDAGSERLRYPHLYFESNFNGGWEEYIDAFSHILTRGMRVFWGSAYGFPKPLPTAPFKAYIKRNEIEASHFYAAYPEATTTMVNSALAIEEKVTEFRASAAKLGPDEFAAAWRRLLADVQEDL